MNPIAASRTRDTGCARRIAAWALVVVVLAPGCTRAAGDEGTNTGEPAGGTTDAPPLHAGARVDLVGAGATFPYPLYARWFNDYAAATGVRINYRSIGSANGIAQLLAGNADFGATEIPMTDAELAATGTGVEHIPTALGAVAITYNVPGLERPLRISGDVAADMFLGRLTRWNDARLRALNPDVSLPADSIRVVYRSDGSGTSYILSDYLSRVSAPWSAGPGRGREVRWPVGTGAAGNEGVAATVRQAPGSLGYVEAVYARQNRLPIARVRNRSGRFVAPLSFEIASAAAASSPKTGASTAADFRVSLVNAPGEHSYPITSFTWLVITPARLGKMRTMRLVDFMHWALEHGSDIATSLGYVPLPVATADRVLERLEQLAPARADQATTADAR